MDTQFHLSNNVYEYLEWMWRMSEQSGVDVENEQRSRVDVKNERAEWIILEYLERERFCKFFS